MLHYYLGVGLVYDPCCVVQYFGGLAMTCVIDLYAGVSTTPVVIMVEDQKPDFLALACQDSRGRGYG